MSTSEVEILSRARPVNREVISQDKQAMSREVIETIQTLDKAKDAKRFTKVLNYLHKFPDVQNQLRIHWIRSLVEEDYGQAVNALRSDLEEFRKNHPAEAFVVTNVVTTWTVLMGFRLIPDEKIQAELKEGRKDRKKSIWRKLAEKFLLNERERDVLMLKELVDLAAKVEAERIKQQRLEAENNLVSSNIEETLSTASSKVQRMFDQASQDGQKIREEAYKARDDARQRTSEIIENAKREERIIEQRVDLLKQEVERLEILKQQILKDREVRGLYEREQQRRLMTVLDTFLASAKELECFFGIDDVLPACRKLYEMLQFIEHDLSMRILAIEEEFGEEARVHGVNLFVSRLKIKPRGLIIANDKDPLLSRTITVFDESTIAKLLSVLATPGGSIVAFREYLNLALKEFGKKIEAGVVTALPERKWPEFFQEPINVVVKEFGTV